MIVEYNKRKIGELNKLVLRMYAKCENILPEIEKLFGIKINLIVVEGETNIHRILASYTWKHWKKYGKLWDISQFIMEVIKFAKQCEKNEKRIKGDSEST